MNTISSLTNSVVSAGKKAVTVAANLPKKVVVNAPVATVKAVKEAAKDANAALVNVKKNSNASPGLLGRSIGLATKKVRDLRNTIVKVNKEAASNAKKVTVLKPYNKRNSMKPFARRLAEFNGPLTNEQLAKAQARLKKNLPKGTKNNRDKKYTTQGNLVKLTKKNLNILGNPGLF